MPSKPNKSKFKTKKSKQKTKKSTKLTNEDIESNFQKRVLYSKRIEKIISKYFSSNNPCSKMWNKLFTGRFVDVKSFFNSEKVATRIGGGTYGDVYRTSLKKAPFVTIAIKKTKNIELEEASKTIFLSALTELGICPNFVIIFAHFHCESMDTKTRPEFALSWKKSFELIDPKRKKLLKLISKNPKNEEEIMKLKFEIQQILKKRYPTKEEEIEWIKNKNNIISDITEVYGQDALDDNGKFNIELLEEDDKKLLTDVVLTSKGIIQERSKWVKSYELLAMEYANGSMESWIKSLRSFDTILSSCFQVCASILTMQANNDLIHNDLGLRNVVFNHVNSGTIFYYKLDEEYYSVPLQGYLFKIIDFGLSVTAKEYMSNDNNKWCPGGDKRNRNIDGRKIDCIPHMRDFIEFFYELLQNTYAVRGNIRKWASMCLEIAKSVQLSNWNPGDSFEYYPIKESKIKSIQYVQNIFSDNILSKFNLKSKFKISKSKIPSKGQIYPVTQSVRKSKLRSIINKKLWYGNV